MTTLWLSRMAQEAVSPIVLSAVAAGAVTLLFMRSIFIKLDGVPGPFPWPLVGQILEAVPYVVTNRLDKFLFERRQKYGPIYRVTLDKTNIIVADPVEAKRILNNPSLFVRSDALRRAAVDLAPNALFVIPSGDHWKKHRKLLESAFGPQQLRLILRLSVESAEEASAAILRNIEMSPSGKSVEVDIYHMFRFMTMDVIGKVDFSHSFSSLASYMSGNEIKDLKKFELFFRTVINRFLIGKSMWPLVSAHETEPKLVEAKQFKNTVLQGLVEKRRVDKAAAAGTAANKPAETKARSEMDVLDRLLERSGDGDGEFTDQEIIDELAAVFLAGHETTTNNMTNMIYCLVQNPDVMKRLVAEIDEVYARLGGNVTTENLHEFRYLEWTMKEAHRLHPVVVLVNRSSVKPVEVLGHRFPADTMFLVSIESLHKDPRYWKDPEVFNPDRWAEPIVPGSYMPFGEGQHMCLGQKVALIEARIMVMHLLRKISFEMVPNQKLEKVMTISTGFKKGFRVRATARATV